MGMCSCASVYRYVCAGVCAGSVYSYVWVECIVMCAYCGRRDNHIYYNLVLLLLLLLILPTTTATTTVDLVATACPVVLVILLTYHMYPHEI